ncbi:MAG: phenylalanine--tRNA ligase beta subunit-related protein, partial [Pyrinomonadaceae bacterium]
MNISYNWLKELIDIELSPEDTAKELTRVGLAVEGVHEHKDDFMLDIDLTSNRPDCLSHLGVARELSVSTGKAIFVDRRSLDRLPDAPFPSLLAADVVKIEDADLCYRFTARIIRGVKIGPSPQWLVDRLDAMGERSINNIADITNYVMLELGQAMHAFDLDKLAGNRLVVRRARSGEKITTLDEVEREIDDSMVMICDAEKPVAVGGIMGGLDSSITDSTTNVLLEVAYFDRTNIRQTSRKLGLATEASYRFERGVDIESLKRASDRATQLIVELAGGSAGEFVDVYPTRVPVK